jgi:acetyltransferase-like isoleucine patch superfamily enzyme
MPFKLGITLRRIIYKPFFKKSGSNLRILDAVVIKYPDEIQLGDNVTINQFCFVVGKGGLTIGNDVMIGSGTKITTSGHNFNNTGTTMLAQGLSFESIEIENDVWLGFNAVVLGGSIIQTGSIVAAGAVVNSGVFDSFSILGGVPAKQIGTRKRI